MGGPIKYDKKTVDKAILDFHLDYKHELFMGIRNITCLFRVIHYNLELYKIVFQNLGYKEEGDMGRR